MKYYSQDEIYFNCECEKCGRVLKIQKNFCNGEGSYYKISSPIQCKCGNLSDDILDVRPSVKVNPDKESKVNVSSINEPIQCPYCKSNNIERVIEQSILPRLFGWSLVCFVIWLILGATGLVLTWLFVSSLVIGALFVIGLIFKIIGGLASINSPKKWNWKCNVCKKGFETPPLN